MNGVSLSAQRNREGTRRKRSNSSKAAGVMRSDEFQQQRLSLSGEKNFNSTVETF